MSIIRTVCLFLLSSISIFAGANDINSTIDIPFSVDSSQGYLKLIIYSPINSPSCNQSSFVNRDISKDIKMEKKAREGLQTFITQEDGQIFCIYTDEKDIANQYPIEKYFGAYKASTACISSGKIDYPISLVRLSDGTLTSAVYAPCKA